MGSFWGDVLHNALSEAKSLPGGVVKTVEQNWKNIPVSTWNLATHAPGSPGFGKALKNFEPVKEVTGVANQYKAIGEHPIRSFKNAPISTTLAVAPVAGAAGKALDAGAEAGAVRLLKPSTPERAAELPKLLDNGSQFPGMRAKNTARLLATDAKDRFQHIATKYEPESGDIPRKPFAGSVPGLKFDLTKLEQLHNDLGRPNITHGGDYVPGGNTNYGQYFIKSQTAHTYLHPEHLNPLVTDTAAGKMLTDTTLHEARHGWQAANWSRPKRFVDSYRSYGKQKAEIDARQWAANNADKYQGLTTRDVNSQHIPQDMRPYGHDPMAQLDDMIAQHAMGEGGVTPEMILTHAEGLVKAGLLDPQEAMDLESHYGASYSKQGSYTPPASKEQLLARAQAQARLK